jgi:two-component system sensor histidine kinase UhpB
MASAHRDQKKNISSSPAKQAIANKPSQQRKKEILQAVLEAHERERQEIANELHENISQSLSSCKLLLGATMKEGTANTEIIERVLISIDKAINELRNISYSLSSSALQLIGLPQALTDLITRMTSQKKINIYLDANKFRSVKGYDPKVYLTLYRVVQEQLLNIVKHSDATLVNIILKISRGTVFIEVNDNGHGFDMTKIDLGLGLTNIFNRVEHYNGKMEIDSKPGKGCSLKAQMPFK